MTPEWPTLLFGNPSVRNEVVVNFANVGHYYGIKVPEFMTRFEMAASLGGQQENHGWNDFLLAKKSLKMIFSNMEKLWG